MKNVSYTATCALLFLALSMGCATLAEQLEYNQQCIDKHQERGPARAHYLCRSDWMSKFIKVRFVW